MLVKVRHSGVEAQELLDPLRSATSACQSPLSSSTSDCYPPDMLQIRQDWSGGIDALVEEANRWLDELLPAERSLRAKDEVNARLVRHYTTVGLLSAPRREGREARYDRHHLLQLLALRRLMADGLSGHALTATLGKADEPTLERLALHGVGQRDELPAGTTSALSYLRTLRDGERQGHDREAATARLQFAISSPAPPAQDVEKAPLESAPEPQVQTLSRIVLRKGLELVMAEGTPLPTSEEAWNTLLAEVRRALVDVQQPRKRRQRLSRP